MASSPPPIPGADSAGRAERPNKFGKSPPSKVREVPLDGFKADETKSSPPPKHQTERTISILQEMPEEKWSDILIATRRLFVPIILVMAAIGFSLTVADFWLNGVLPSWADLDLVETVGWWVVAGIVVALFLVPLTRPRNIAFATASTAAAVLATVIGAVAFFAGAPERVVVALNNQTVLTVSLERTTHSTESVQSPLDYFLVRFADNLPLIVGLAVSVVVFRTVAAMIIQLHNKSVS